MNKETLYKFFAGTTTASEKEEIKKWLEENQAHEEELIKERNIFNAVIITKPVGINKKPAKTKTVYIPVIKEVLKIAALVAFVVITLNYYHSKEINKISSTSNIVTVPPGQRVNLLLPDNTNVWLNAGSKLKYPAYFTGNLREVELHGEAFFDVTTDKKKPFIVRTGIYDIEVLGTSFNVETYADKELFSVSLLKGSIKIITKDDEADESLILNPGYRAQMKHGKLVQNQITDFEYYRWQEGLICFKDMPFVELMKRFETCYDVKIIIENTQIGNNKFGGKFRISDGIDNALRLLQKDARYDYEKNKDGTVIYIK